METVFFRLLPYADKGAALAEAIDALQQGQPAPAVHTVNPASFKQIPGSPFAYWVSENIRQIFTRLPATQNNAVRVCEGLNTTDNERFLRLCWEVPALNIGKLKRWVTLAKGGEYSLFYSDLHLLIDWENDGYNLKKLVRELYGTETKRIYGQPFYFLPGITYSQRTQKGLSFRCLPSNSIFNVKGPGIFASIEKLPFLLGLLNSSIYKALVELQTAFGSYNVGYLQKTPLPSYKGGNDHLELELLVLFASKLLRETVSIAETTHEFTLPAILQAGAASLAHKAAEWQQRLAETARQLEENQRQIDEIAFRLYGIEGADRQAIEASLQKPTAQPETAASESAADEEEETEAAPAANAPALVADLFSWAVGSALGRWDVRLATGQRAIPALPDPFAPLPACSPGMLTGADGLPLAQPPAGYPLAVADDGILVDDSRQSADIVKRVRDVLALLWGEQADALEQEACTLLGVKTLRDYLRNSSKGGFWLDHVGRYSKSRRKAPIYWLLQSAKRNYGLWLYYHKLDKNMLFNALSHYVEPKLRQEQAELEKLRASLSAGGEGKPPKQLEKEIEKQLDLISEVQDFRDKLKRVADLYLESDLNDGVVLNIAPLRELVPWPEAKKYWTELTQGKYTWSSISQQLQQKGYVKPSIS